MIIIFTSPFPSDLMLMGGKYIPPTGDYLEDALADLAECLGADCRTFELHIKKAATWGENLRVALEKAHCENSDFIYTWPGDDGCERFTVVRLPIECRFDAPSGEWVPA